MRTAVAIRQAALAAIIAQFNSGYIRFYNGTRPTNADTALSGNTLLATCRFGATAGTATGGVFTAGAITADSNSAASGTPTFVRILASDGTTVLADASWSVNGGGGEVQTPAASIVAGGTTSVSSFTITYPVGT